MPLQCSPREKRCKHRYDQEKSVAIFIGYMGRTRNLSHRNAPYQHRKQNPIRAVNPNEWKA